VEHFSQGHFLNSWLLRCVLCAIVNPQRRRSSPTSCNSIRCPSPTTSFGLRGLKAKQCTALTRIRRSRQWHGSGNSREMNNDEGGCVSVYALDQFSRLQHGTAWALSIGDHLNAHSVHAASVMLHGPMYRPTSYYSLVCGVSTVRPWLR